MIELNTPSIFKGLWTEKKRFKIMFGGRGSGKSWQIARFLIIKAYQSKKRILCCREIQKSIQDSVHRLLADQISLLGMDCYFSIKNREIESTNGSIFLFEGLRQNVTKIKSLEGLDYVWVEEGESITENSWDVLIPTVRKPESEIIISFNPSRDDDPTYKMFVSHKRDDSWVQQINYTDNPFFCDPLKSEMERCKKINNSKYLHIWEGQPITNYETLVYRFDHKINCVESEIVYNKNSETWTGWDFGVADDTVILFFQVEKVPKSEEYPMGVRINVFDEYVNNNRPAEHYREVVDKKGYDIKYHACDPSGVNRDSSLNSWISLLSKDSTGSNKWSFIYNHKHTVSEMIDQANNYMHAIRYNYNQVPNFHKMIRHWQYRTDKNGKISLPTRPEHDEYSHVGTAFYYFIINRFPIKKGEVYLP